MKTKILSLVAAVLFTLPASAAKIKGSRIGANSESAGFFVEAYAKKGRILFKSVKFDAQGKFVLDFPTDEALIYWIDNFPVYIQANEELEVVLPERKGSAFVLGGPANQQAATASLATAANIAVAGKSKINNLLINEINAAWAALVRGKSQSLTPADIESKYALVSGLIKKSKNPELNSVAEFYNQIGHLEARLQYLRANPAVQPDKNYFEVLSKLSLNNPAVNSLKPIGIRALVANYYAFLKLSEGASINDEDLKDNSSEQKMQYLLKNVSNERIINEELNQSIVYHLSIKGWNTGLDQIMVSAMKKTTDTAARNNLKALQERYSKVSKNAKAPDFSIPDAKGKMVNLSDFTGKIVAIDVWATWCIPCMHSLPYFLDLREKYKDNPNVVFLSISTDNDASKAKWLSFLKSKNMNGVDLHAGDQRSSAFTKAYNITGIPRYILIDREGKIIEDHAPQASEPAYEALIENALKSK